MANNDDYKVRTYQDDLSADSQTNDDVTTENDDLSVQASIPASRLKKEFDDMDSDNSPLGTKDDIEEEIEDSDETPDQPRLP